MTLMGSPWSHLRLPRYQNLSQPFHFHISTLRGEIASLPFTFTSLLGTAFGGCGQSLLTFWSTYGCRPSRDRDRASGSRARDL